LAAEPREDHASYIENWLRVLRNDRRAIFTAAAHAERAAAFLHNAASRIMPRQSRIPLVYKPV
jgi:antirestriction protein ArdC